MSVNEPEYRVVGNTVVDKYGQTIATVTFDTYGGRVLRELGYLSGTQKQEIMRTLEKNGS